MSGEVKFCDRCGGRLGRISFRVEAVPSGGAEAGPALAIDACKDCGQSLTRWLDRGRSRANYEPRTPEPRIAALRGRRFRPSRDQAMLAAVIVLSLLCCFFLYRGSR